MAEIYYHSNLLSESEREKLYGHKSACLWFTGLSGSGKSTLAAAAEKRLYDMKAFTYILDGDNIRHGLNSDLGFSAEDRKENIRRIGEVAKLFTEAGLLVLTAFISPYRADRAAVRKLLGNKFIEIYVRCPIEVCEQRDPKGLYKKARNNEIKDFTGISAPYEEPEEPELIIDNSDKWSVEHNVEQIIGYLKNRQIIK